MSADSRSYVMGLPVTVVVHPDGFVTVEVDLDELAEGIREEESNLDGATPEQVEEDAKLAEQWANTHMVRTEGYVQ